MARAATIQQHSAKPYVSRVSADFPLAKMGFAKKAVTHQQDCYNLITFRYTKVQADFSRSIKCNKNNICN